MNNVTEKVIVALDVANYTDAIALVEKLPEVSFWKVGLELFISNGPEILQYLQEKQKRIFLDLKLHDIPNTVAGATRSVLNYQVDFLTIHTSAGRKALQAASEIVIKAETKTKLLGISLLTSIDSRALAFELKIPLELPEYTLQMALLAKESGLQGAVCSPKEVEQLRQVCGDNFLLICPGVRPTWSESGDQKRVMTPSQALKVGADYLVIGRPINASPNPVEAWQRLCQDLSAS